MARPRTEEQMKALLKDKLYIGKTVKIEQWATESAGYSYKFKGSRKGKVVALCPHIFTVKIGNVLESFRYSQIFKTGTERVKLKS